MDKLEPTEEGKYEFTESQLRDILENCFDAGRLYEEKWDGPDRETYIDSLLNTGDEAAT